MIIKAYYERTITKIIHDIKEKDVWLMDINKHRPAEIFCSRWSETKPFLVIHAYEELGDSPWLKVLVTCEAYFDDKRPEWRPIGWLYDNFKYSGLSQFTFKSTTNADENTDN